MSSNKKGSTLGKLRKIVRPMVDDLVFEFLEKHIKKDGVIKEMIMEAVIEGGYLRKIISEVQEGMNQGFINSHQQPQHHQPQQRNRAYENFQRMQQSQRQHNLVETQQPRRMGDFKAPNTQQQPQNQQQQQAQNQNNQRKDRLNAAIQSKVNGADVFEGVDPLPNDPDTQEGKYGALSGVNPNDAGIDISGLFE